MVYSVLGKTGIIQANDRMLRGSTHDDRHYGRRQLIVAYQLMVVAMATLAE